MGEPRNQTTQRLAASGNRLPALELEGQREEVEFQDLTCPPAAGPSEELGPLREALCLLPSSVSPVFPAPLADPWWNAVGSHMAREPGDRWGRDLGAMGK